MSLCRSVKFNLLCLIAEHVGRCENVSDWTKPSTFPCKICQLIWIKHPLPTILSGFLHSPTRQPCVLVSLSFKVFGSNASYLASTGLRRSSTSWTTTTERNSCAAALSIGKKDRSFHNALVYTLFFPPDFESPLWWFFLTNEDFGGRFDDPIPVCAFFSFFFAEEISLRTQVPLLGQDQSTVALWVKTTVAKCSLMSCKWACFPAGFPHNAWTA